MDSLLRNLYHFLFTLLWMAGVAWFYIWLFGGLSKLTIFRALIILALVVILGPIPGFFLSLFLFPVCFPETARKESEERERISAECYMAQREAWQAAMVEWSIEIIEDVIDRKDSRKVNVRDSYDRKMIQYAIQANRHDLVQGLIDLGAEVNYVSRLKTYSPLCCAAEFGDGDMIRLLCSSGARVDRKYHFSWTSAYMSDAWGDGFTALHFAARAGNLSTVVALVELGADVNAVTDYLEQTPLLKAVEFIVGDYEKVERHRKVVNFLLDSGADPMIDAMSDSNLCDLNRVHQFAERHSFTRLLEAMGRGRKEEEPDDTTSEPFL